MTPQEALARWQPDPVLFSREVLRVEPWKRQAEVMQAVVTNRRVAARSGHKVGKSTLDVCLALWFVCCFPDAKVIMTAPTGRQVREILWGELQRVYRLSRGVIGGTLNETPSGGLRFPDGRRVFGFATDEPERMAGFSGANTLFIVDEASGVTPAIFEAIKGNMTGGGRLLMTGNPTQTSGEFFDAFHDKRALYSPHHISSLEAAELGILNLATKEDCALAAEDYGVTSPLYHVRILGEFPTEASNAVVALYLVEAGDKVVNPSEDGRLHLGVDVARFGDDDSVICPRRALRVYPLEIVHGFDIVQVAGKTIEVARTMRRNDAERPLVKVDTTGLGAGVADILRRETWLEIVDVNSSERSNDPERFPNIRSEMMFGVADYLKAGGGLPGDRKLSAELVAPKYDIDAKGRRRAESKDEIKKRIRRSPDRGDAVALAILDPRRGGYAGPLPGVEEYHSPMGGW